MRASWRASVPVPIALWAIFTITLKKAPTGRSCFLFNPLDGTEDIGIVRWCGVREGLWYESGVGTPTMISIRPLYNPASSVRDLLLT